MNCTIWRSTSMSASFSASSVNAIVAVVIVESPSDRLVDRTSTISGTTMATPSGIAVATRQAASGYALRALPRRKTYTTSWDINSSAALNPTLVSKPYCSRGAAPESTSMRSTLPDTKRSEHIAANPGTDRTLRAAHLLREALALLGEAPQLLGSTNATREADRLLRLPEVQRLTGLRRSAIYQQMQRGIFPRSVKAGPRVASWSEAAIQAWIAERLGGTSSLSRGASLPE